MVYIISPSISSNAKGKCCPNMDVLNNNSFKAILSLFKVIVLVITAGKRVISRNKIERSKKYCRILSACIRIVVSAAEIFCWVSVSSTRGATIKMLDTSIMPKVISANNNSNLPMFLPAAGVTGAIFFVVMF